jgi:AcrR family transcriptional regulator
VKNADRRAQSTEKLLNATIELLRENGFAAFRVADVALRSGVSHGLLFRYFPTKYDLFRGVLEVACERSLTLIRNAVAELEKHASDYEAPIQGLLWVMLQQDRWIYELIFATRYDAELLGKVQDVYRNYIAGIDQISRQFSENTGLFSVADADIAARLVGWAFHGLIMNEESGAVEADERQRMIRLISQLFQASYPIPK